MARTTWLDLKIKYLTKHPTHMKVSRFRQKTKSKRWRPVQGPSGKAPLQYKNNLPLNLSNQITRVVVKTPPKPTLLPYTKALINPLNTQFLISKNKNEKVLIKHLRLFFETPPFVVNRDGWKRFTTGGWLAAALYQNVNNFYKKKFINTWASTLIKPYIKIKYQGWANKWFFFNGGFSLRFGHSHAVFFIKPNYVFFKKYKRMEMRFWGTHKALLISYLKFFVSWKPSNIYHKRGISFKHRVIKNKDGKVSIYRY